MEQPKIIKGIEPYSELRYPEFHSALAQTPIVVAASRDGTHLAVAFHRRPTDVNREIGILVKTEQSIVETTALLWKLREFTVTRMESKMIRLAYSDHKEYSGTSW